MARSKIVPQLERIYGGSWKAVRSDTGGFSWMYVQDGTGMVVRCYGESVLTHDGYSDTEFLTVYYIGGSKIGAAGVIWGKTVG